MNWSEADLAAYLQRKHSQLLLRQQLVASVAATRKPERARAEAPAMLADGVAKRSRFGNVKTLGPAPWGGQRQYDSKREAQKALELRDREQCGQNAGWFCQVSIPIGVDDAGREIRARVDFIEIFLDRGPIIWDPKGYENNVSRVKRAALRARGFDVRLW